ncbi:Sensor histidine kinase YycG [Rubripirellula tenax]|uniref:histidine kinase n=1 Tax=Rubripirellula tenax TaxID=2528015 RepID=A0A5C6FGD7_9BACT|nr:Sensor histidine kinase YycG [Rubripirellula tenax]
MTFLTVAICILACTIGAASMPLETGTHSLLWIIALAACCTGGLVAMSSVRAIRTIEVELRRGTALAPNAGNDSSPTAEHRLAIQRRARSVFGNDPVADGWNQLMETIHFFHMQSSAPQSQTDRPTASLDKEAVTLARAMRGLPVAWVITDNDGNIRFMSPAACGMLSLDEDSSKLAGRDLAELLGLRDESDPADLEQLFGPVRMVHCRRRLTVQSNPLQIRITRSRLAGRRGDVEGLAWILLDITQQRLATEARDDFLMTATHELRTPLTNLQAYAEALQQCDDLQVDRQKEFCNVINSEANRLGRLIDQLLTVSQMEAGSMVVNRHQLDVLPLVTYAAEQLTAQAEQKSIAIVTRVLAKSPVVYGDRDKLLATLVNLLGNAIKYTPDGGEVVLRVASDERWIRIDIEDNGPGIPEDEQPKVFDKFYRCVATRESTERGNGLGLAFAREVARLHGGDLDLRSTLGEGSVFTLRLPTPAAGSTR